LNFALSYTDPSIYGRVRLFYPIRWGYKQSGWGEGVKTGANASPDASHNKKWATA